MIRVISTVLLSPHHYPINFIKGVLVVVCKYNYKTLLPAASCMLLKPGANPSVGFAIKKTLKGSRIACTRRR